MSASASRIGSPAFPSRASASRSSFRAASRALSGRLLHRQLGEVQPLGAVGEEGAALDLAAGLTQVAELQVRLLGLGGVDGRIAIDTAQIAQAGLGLLHEVEGLFILGERLGILA